jgi:hypothetical protein
MQLTINIKDSDKAKVFLNFIKSLDYITVQENEEEIYYPSMSDRDIIDRIDRVAETNEEIKQGKTTLHDDFVKESKKW